MARDLETNYMLDTNICIYIMKNHYSNLIKRLSLCPIDSVSISSIVLAELWFGVANSQRLEKNTKALNEFLRFCGVRDWPIQAASIYGDIRAKLQQTGNIIGGNDLLIAAHAIHFNAVLVTNNCKEFEHVPDLEIENWCE